MKTKAFIYTTLLAIVFSIPLVSQAQGDSGEIPVPLSDPARRGKIKVYINYGSITVKGTTRKDVLVKYSSVGERDKKPGETKDGLRRIGGGTLDLEVSENNNLVSIKSGSWNNKISLYIEVPSGIDMNLRAYNDGDIEVNDIQGQLELNNYNGEITAENISGSVVATTYNGEIKATFDKVNENTPMSFVTYNGDVDITFPAALKASLKMKTNQGEILTGFDVNLIKSGPVTKSDSRSGVYKVTLDEWVKGDINGGGPEFIMKNYNGDIIIRKK